MIVRKIVCRIFVNLNFFLVNNDNILAVHGLTCSINCLKEFQRLLFIKRVLHNVVWVCLRTMCIDLLF